MEWRNMYISITRKRRNFDYISVTSCTESCQIDNLRCNQFSSEIEWIQTSLPRTHFPKIMSS